MTNARRRTQEPSYSAGQRKAVSGKRPSVPEKTTTTALAGSNSLVDLAARIRVEHDAASEKLSEALRHAMAAGDLLIEAKALVNKHGQWLPWLKDHVAISERTAQIYMRVAKSRAEIEASKAQSPADLSLGEAVSLLALSSDVRKLFAFVKECEGLDGEELVQACIDANVGLIRTPNYNPFAGWSDEERREWKLFTLWLVSRQGRSLDWAEHHVEWLLRGSINTAEWMGEKGRRCRAMWMMPQPSEAVMADWASFAAERELMTETEIDAEIAALENAASTTPATKGRRR